MRGDSKRIAARRRFARLLLPVAAVLLAVGAVLAGKHGVLGVVGLVTIAQGIGLLVAILWLGMGHNPLSDP